MPEDVSQTISETLSDLLNETLSTNNATSKIPSTVEGQALAYTSLVLMAIFPILIGSFRSVKVDEKPEVISKQDAMQFPILASGVLFGIFLFFKMLSPEYINIIIGLYFFLLGVFAMSKVSSKALMKLIPSSIPNTPYHLILNEGGGNGVKALIDWKFTNKDLVGVIICTILSAWYAVQKHWIANNLMGMAFAINGVELLHLSSISTGCILLAGLFLYDVFWVFGTNVMVTVAKNFNAPIKVIFPQDFLEHGVFGKNFAMLGLGDIVVPGIFIALLLRYDMSLGRNKRTYFYSGFVAYLVGLVTTIVVMTVFQHPQPALLYLVPACVGTPVSLAFFKGDLESMFQYSDEEQYEKNLAKDKKEVEDDNEAKKSQ